MLEPTTKKPAPPLTATSPDEMFLAALHRQPTALMRAQMEATNAYRAIRESGLAEILGVEAFWQRMRQQTAASNPRDLMSGGPDQVAANEAAAIRQLRIAIDGRDTLCAIVADIPKINFNERLWLGGGNALANPAVLHARLRVLAVQQPGLAAWQARRDTELSERQKQIAEQQKRQTEAAATQRKADRHVAAVALMRRLARDGVHLALGRPEGISARPAALLSQQDAAAIAELRPELTAILTAPAELVA